jgi:hypothetical protein
LACTKERYRHDDMARKIFHTHQRMPFETEEEFQKRFGKRIVIQEGETVTILDPFGKLLKTIKLDKDIENNHS